MKNMNIPPCPDHNFKKISISQDEFLCYICKTAWHGTRYQCSVCNLGRHEECVNNPVRLSSDHHPEHQLTLLGGACCDVCREVLIGPVYECRECNFDVHSFCLGKPVVKEKTFDLDRDGTTFPAHLSSHHHPKHQLTFSSGTINSRRCDVCSKIIAGPVYACRECDFDVHPFCLEKPKLHDDCAITTFPAKLSSHHHTTHQLTLKNHTLKCYMCRESIFGFMYACRECEFFVHLSCLTKPAVVQEKVKLHQDGPTFPPYLFSGHHRKHVLTLNSRAASCDVCKEVIHNHNYTCFNCNFDVHPLCLLEPVVEEKSKLEQIVKIGVGAIRIASFISGLFPSP